MDTHKCSWNSSSDVAAPQVVIAELDKPFGSALVRSWRSLFPILGMFRGHMAGSRTDGVRRCNEDDGKRVP